MFVLNMRAGYQRLRCVRNGASQCLNHKHLEGSLAPGPLPSGGLCGASWFAVLPLRHAASHFDTTAASFHAHKHTLTRYHTLSRAGLSRVELRYAAPCGGCVMRRLQRRAVPFLGDIKDAPSGRLSPGAARDQWQP